MFCRKRADSCARRGGTRAFDNQVTNHADIGGMVTHRCRSNHVDAERVGAGTGIDVEIVPGILPVTNFAQVVRFAASCGTAIPQWMADLFEGLDDDPETRKLIAASVACEQCRALDAAGFKQFHFYTVNRADLTYAICHVLGLGARARSDCAPGAV